MKKFIFILELIIFWAIQSYCQEIISSAGKHHAAGNIQVSWTLGEPIIETLIGDGNILTQGFHQPKLTVTPVFTLNETSGIKVYPNPSSRIVYIELAGQQPFNATAELYSPDGKLRKQQHVNNERAILNVQELPNGSYLLKISKDKELLKTFKLVKGF